MVKHSCLVLSQILEFFFLVVVKCLVSVSTVISVRTTVIKYLKNSNIYGWWNETVLAKLFANSKIHVPPTWRARTVHDA